MILMNLCQTHSGWGKNEIVIGYHAFIWWDSEPERLLPNVLALCQNPENTLVLSVVSVWEMQIKLQLGKLKQSLPLSILIENQKTTNDIQLLSVELDHVLALEKLPSHHKDPFDRLLIAQANLEDFVVVSNDPIFKKYPVKVVW